MPAMVLKHGLWGRRNNRQRTRRRTTSRRRASIKRDG